MKHIKVEAEICTSVELDGLTYDVEATVQGSGYYDPGRGSGPPEDCYPPEGEMEILSVVADITDSDKRVVTGEEHQRVMATLGDEALTDALWEALYMKLPEGV